MTVPRPIERIVVVSPHLDDGVLSVGASMSSWARGGAYVELLTVLSGDPASQAPAGGWDRRAGYATEGEASRARRQEDSRACALLRAAPVWLDFGYQDYERHGTENDVRTAVAEAIRDADVVLAPGSPLSHPDHEWVVRTVADAALQARQLGVYLEQPYGVRSGDTATPAWLDAALGSPLAFADSSVRARDRVAKWRAVRQYTSQLPLLALGRRQALSLALRPERVAWLDGSPH